MHFHPRARRAALLVTCLFLTCILYLLMLALFGQAHQNIRLTSGAHERIQAHFAARGAAQVGLSRINSDPSWLATHLAPAGSVGIPPQAETVQVGQQKAFVWVEASRPPDFYSLVGSASSGTSVRRQQVVVYKDFANQPQMAASTTAGFQVYRIDPSVGIWAPAPLALPLGWVANGASWAPSLLPPPPPQPPSAGPCLTGQANSSLYLTVKLNGQSSVLMLAPGASHWSLLPPLLLSGNQQAQTVRQLLATKDRLYCLAQLDGGNPELLQLVDPASAQTLRDPISGHFTVGGAHWEPVSLPPGLSSAGAVAASDRGQIYIAGPNHRIYLGDSGHWTPLPSVPSKYWAPTATGFEVRDLNQTPGNDLPKGMITDPLGNLYLNRQVNNFSTFFKYVPGESGQEGYFRMLAPFAQPGSAEGVAHDFGGYLYARICIAGVPDQIVYGDVDTPGRTANYQTLPAIPSSLGKVDAIGPVGVPGTSIPHFRPIFTQ